MNKYFPLPFFLTFFSMLLLQVSLRTKKFAMPIQQRTRQLSELATSAINAMSTTYSHLPPGYGKHQASVIQNSLQQPHSMPPPNRPSLWPSGSPLPISPPSQPIIPLDPTPLQQPFKTQPLHLSTPTAITKAPAFQRILSTPTARLRWAESGTEIRFIEGLFEHGEDVRDDYFRRAQKYFPTLSDRLRLVASAHLRIVEPFEPEMIMSKRMQTKMQREQIRIQTRVTKVGNKSCQMSSDYITVPESQTNKDFNQPWMTEEKESEMVKQDRSSTSKFATMETAVVWVDLVGFDKSSFKMPIFKTVPGTLTQPEVLESPVNVEYTKIDRGLMRAKPNISPKIENTKDGSKSSNLIRPLHAFNLPFQLRESDRDSYGHVTNSRVVSVMLECFHAGMAQGYYANGKGPEKIKNWLPKTLDRLHLFRSAPEQQQYQQLQVGGQEKRLKIDTQSQPRSTSSSSSSSSLSSLALPETPLSPSSFFPLSNLPSPPLSPTLPPSPISPLTTLSSTKPSTLTVKSLGESVAADIQPGTAFYKKFQTHEVYVEWCHELHPESPKVQCWSWLEKSSEATASGYDVAVVEVHEIHPVTGENRVAAWSRFLMAEYKPKEK